MKFFVIFSQILSTFNQFVGQYDDIHVINLSMGYNWRPNFGVNPDLPKLIHLPFTRRAARTHA